MTMLVQLLLNAGVVLLVSKLVPGVRLGGYGSALMVAGVYGALNWCLWYVFWIFALPFMIVTLGVGLLVLNGFLLWVTDKILESFELKSFGALVLATLGITAGNTLVSWVLSS